MSKPDVLIEIRDGLPYVTCATDGLTIEVRDFDTKGLCGGVGVIRYDDTFLPKDETCNHFKQYTWLGKKELIQGAP